MMAAMKDSGIEWIGEMPEDWNNCTPLRFCASLNIATSPFDPEKPYLALENISSWTGKIKSKEQPDQVDSLVANYSRSDVLFGKLRPYLAKVVRPTADGQCSTELLPISPTSLDHDYLFWLLINKGFIDTVNSMTYGVKMPRTSWLQLGALYCPVPPRKEQANIAAFLDNRCADIDNVSQTLESQIALLKRYRASVIHEAVTRGLNPNVPTKPSGVDWIGSIPEDWDVTPLGYLGSFQNGISKDGDSFGEGHPFVSYGDVYSSRSLPATVRGLVKSNTDEQFRYSVKTGDVFFTRTSETASEIAFASTCFSTIEKATFAGFLIRFRPNGNRLNPRYGSYYFRNTGLRNYFVKEMMIVTRASLGQQLLKRLPVLIPSIDEQERIANYLDARTAAIDAVLDTKRKQLDILKRRRQSLIYEYVTGKRRVIEEA